MIRGAVLATSAELVVALLLLVVVQLAGDYHRARAPQAAAGWVDERPRSRLGCAT